MEQDLLNTQEQLEHLNNSFVYDCDLTSSTETNAPSCSESTGLRLLKRTQNGCELSKGLLLEHYINYIKMFTRQFSINHLSIEQSDLVNAGCIGFLNSLNGFNPDKGYSLMTYARSFIIGEMSKVCNNGHVVNITSYQRRKNNVAGLAIADNTANDTYHQNYSQTHLPNNLNVKTLNHVDIDTLELASAPEQIEEALTQEKMNAVLKESIQRLSEIQQEIIVLSAGLFGHTALSVAEISKKLFLPQKEVRAELNSAKTQLKHILQFKDINFFN